MNSYISEDRKLSELLQILLDNIHNVDGDGLCWRVHRLHSYGIFNNIERWVILDYIKDNPPKLGWLVRFFNKIDNLLIDTIYIDPVYGNRQAAHNQLYWMPGYMYPRVKWLKHHIKKLNNTKL